MRSFATLPLIALIGFLAAATIAAGAEAPLVLDRTIPLDGVSGRIDHMAADVAGQRLFVAELGNDSVGIIELKAGRILSRIGGLKAPQGIAYVADQDAIVIANAGDGSVRFFRATNLSQLGSIQLGDDADNVRIDPTTRSLLVGYGNGGLAIIEGASRSSVGNIKLAGHPEGFQIDPNAQRAFVNIPDAHQIAVVDLAARKQSAAWNVPGLAANFPMALVRSGKTLAVAFRRPATLAILDAATGAVQQQLGICSDADDVFDDAKRARIYVSCGGGSVDVVERGDQGYRIVGRIPTRSGARTALFVPELDLLFVAAPAGWLGPGAAILIFRPTP